MKMYARSLLPYSSEEFKVIGMVNHQWGMKKPPLLEVSLYKNPLSQ